jgi:WD40 repeat protein
MAPAGPILADETELCAVLHSYLAALDSGAAPDRTDLLARHPEFATELQEFFGELDRLDSLARVLSDTPAGGAATGDFRPDAPAGRRVPGLAAGVAFGDYELRAEIAQGGMGVVWRAWQCSADRDVAIKLVPAGPLTPAADLARFRAEAETAANLDHPNIVPIYEVGTWTDGGGPGAAFFTMKLLPDGPLSQHKARFHGAWRAAARIVATAARAVHHAHQRGILHRDLKPGNILLAGDEPFVADFGLAKRLASDGPTVTGAIIGTPAYMAPEQAAGLTRQLTTAVDVYGLGAVLYELLTGRPPFRGETPLDTLHQVVASEPVPPRQVDAKVPRDLQVICLKCLHKEPAKRYESAEALADDLERWLVGQPILARPARPWERAWKWARRNPAVAALAAAVALAVAGGIGYGAWQYRQTASALHQSETANYANHIQLAASYVKDGQPDRADEQLELCPPERRGWEWHYLRRLCHPPVVTLRGHGRMVTAVQYSPDGSQVATGSRDGTARLWDAATGRELAVLPGHAGGVTSVSFRSDGRVLATAGEDHSVILWEAATGRELRRLAGAGSLAAFTTGPRLAVARNETVILWDGDTGERVLTFRSRERPVVALAVTADGTRLATASSSHPLAVPVWDTADGREVGRVSPGDDVMLGAIAFHPDGRHLAVTTDGWPQLWDWQAARRVRRFPLSDRSPALAFTSDGGLLAAANSFGLIRVFDTRSGNTVYSPRAHGEIVAALAFSPDGGRLAVPRGAAVELEPARPSRGLASRTISGRGPAFWLSRLAFSPDGARLAATWHGADDRCAAATYDLIAGREVGRLEPPAHGSGWNWGAVAIRPDGGGRFAQNRQDDRRLTVFDLDAGRPLYSVPGFFDAMNGLDFSPDGRRLAYPQDSRAAAIVCDADTGELVRELHDQADADHHVVVRFSPDGRRLAGGGRGLVVSVWDLPTGQPWRTLTGHSRTVQALAFSPDGRRLATGAVDQTIRLWDLESGRELAVLRGHTGSVSQVYFNTDGRRLVSLAADGTIKVWDADGGLELLTLSDDAGLLNGLAFSPDGRLVAATCVDGSVKIYDGTPLPQTED